MDWWVAKYYVWHDFVYELLQYYVVYVFLNLRSSYFYILFMFILKSISYIYIPHFVWFIQLDSYYMWRYPKDKYIITHDKNIAEIYDIHFHDLAVLVEFDKEGVLHSTSSWGFIYLHKKTNTLAAVDFCCTHHFLITRHLQLQDPKLNHLPSIDMTHFVFWSRQTCVGYWASSVRVGLQLSTYCSPTVCNLDQLRVAELWPWGHASCRTTNSGSSSKSVSKIYPEEDNSKDSVVEITKPQTREH